MPIKVEETYIMSLENKLEKIKNLLKQIKDKKPIAFVHHLDDLEKSFGQVIYQCRTVLDKEQYFKDKN